MRQQEPKQMDPILRIKLHTSSSAVVQSEVAQIDGVCLIEADDSRVDWELEN